MNKAPTFLGFVVGFVIQASGRPEFEDSSRIENQPGPKTVNEVTALYLRSILPLIQGQGLLDLFV